MSVETQPNQPIKPQFDVGRLRSFLQKKFHLPERQKLRVLSRLAAVGIVAIASLAAVNLALANPTDESYYDTSTIGHSLVVSGTRTIFEREKYARQIQNLESVEVEERRTVGEGGVLDAWIERYSCGYGTNMEGRPDVSSWMTYLGGPIIATQTHFLETTSWARGTQFVDDLNAPPTWVITWGTWTALNPNDPTPGLPIRWGVVQKASDKETGEELFSEQNILECPYVVTNKAIVDATTWFTVSEANASEFDLQVGNRKIREEGGVFSYTFPRTGDYQVKVTARGLGKTEVSRVINVQVTENSAPVADAGSDQVTTPGSVVQLDGSGSFDLDGHGFVCGWQQTGGTPVELNNNTICTPVFTAPSAGLITFTLGVTDELGLPSQPDEVLVKIENRSYIPIVIR